MKVYKDAKGRPYKWRALILGRWKTIGAHSIEEAQSIAEAMLVEANSEPVINGWMELVNIHLARREAAQPGLIPKKSWETSQYALKKFAREINEITSPDCVKMPHFLLWWDQQSYYQQCSVRAELRRFMNWAMLSEVITLPANPINVLDKKANPGRARHRMTPELFRAVLSEAKAQGYAGLLLAMKLSLATSLRRGDITDLVWTDVVDNALCVTVNKSASRLGSVRAARLRWDLDKHPHIKELLQECKYHAKLNDDCPYIVSARHTQPWEDPPNHFKMSPEMVTRQFTTCMRSVLPSEPNHPTFHEIRSLSASLLENSGVGIDEIKGIMAHTNTSTTSIYLNGHERKFFEVEASNTGLEV